VSQLFLYQSHTPRFEVFRCIFCPEKYECFFKVFSFGLLLSTFVFVENSGNMKNQTPFFEKLFWSTFGLI
jgi:hypothetical protein